MTFCIRGGRSGRAEQHSISLSSLGKHRASGLSGPPAGNAWKTCRPVPLCSVNQPSVAHAVTICRNPNKRRSLVRSRDDSPRLTYFGRFWARDVFEISNCRVLCEKASSHSCHAIRSDQSEQVWAIINARCGPVVCDSHGMDFRNSWRHGTTANCDAIFCRAWYGGGAPLRSTFSVDVWVLVSILRGSIGLHLSL